MVSVTSLPKGRAVVVSCVCDNMIGKTYLKQLSKLYMFEFHCNLQNFNIRHVLVAAAIKLRQLHREPLVLKIVRTLHKM